jgi:hypothetical protein
MSEKSLEIRQKFINKILKKVDSLEESLTLLSNVDKRMLKKDIQLGGARLRNLHQMGGFLYGGDGEEAAAPDAGLKPTESNSAPAALGGKKDLLELKGIQKQALISRVRLAKQREALEKAQKTIWELNNNLSGIRASILSISKLMEGLNEDMPKLDEANIPNLSSYMDVYLWNAFHGIHWENLQNLPKDGVNINEKLRIKPMPVGENKLIRLGELLKVERDEYEAMVEEVQAPVNEISYEQRMASDRSANIQNELSTNPIIKNLASKKTPPP